VGDRHVPAGEKEMVRRVDSYAANGYGVNLLDGHNPLMETSRRSGEVNSRPVTENRYLWTLSECHFPAGPVDPFRSDRLSVVRDFVETMPSDDRRSVTPSTMVSSVFEKTHDPVPLQ
jgi:hypothetical protein